MTFEDVLEEDSIHGHQYLVPKRKLSEMVGCGPLHRVW